MMSSAVGTIGSLAHEAARRFGDPAELEQVLALHPAVAMSAVGAVPDQEKGELAKAYVVLRHGAQCDERVLREHCREHLAAYKVPRLFAFVEDLPKTSTGKILRRALREAFEPAAASKEEMNEQRLHKMPSAQ